MKNIFRPRIEIGEPVEVAVSRRTGRMVFRNRFGEEITEEDIARFVGVAVQGEEEVRKNGYTSCMPLSYELPMKELDWAELVAANRQRQLEMLKACIEKMKELQTISGGMVFPVPNKEINND